MNCEFLSLKKGTPCSRGCGRKLAMNFTQHPAAECKSVAPGDAIEELPSSYGITKEWSAALKENKNRQPECHHDDGDVGVTLKVECSCNATGEKNTTVHQCNITSIRRCLPHFHPNKNDRQKWADRKPESDIYQLCDACEHFQFKGASQ